ncbi:MAG: hypothetical protein U9O64_11730 [Campylobacterota bacterium]|nr:hypothetical protein [Campylobacterota bacterium]
MKNLLESFAILLVGLLSIAVVFWIVQYNMIEDADMIEDIEYEVVKKEVSQKEKATNYLQNLEGYEDVDVEVDATKETRTNTVVVKSELNNDALEAAVEDKSKSSYAQNLENYKEPKREEMTEDDEASKPVSDSEPEELEPEIEDEIGMAIDAALNDL